MIIQLDRVVFDHTAGAAQTDALSIRIDGATAAPDWIRGAAQTSYAAYALVPTVNQQISIQADFSFPQPPPVPSWCAHERSIKATGCSETSSRHPSRNRVGGSRSTSLTCRCGTEAPAATR